MTDDEKAKRLLSGKYCGNCLFGNCEKEIWNCLIEQNLIEQKMTGKKISTEKYKFCRFWMEEAPTLRDRMTIG